MRITQSSPALGAPLAAVLAILVALLVGSTLIAQSRQARRDVAKTYARLCANCHGAKLEGALAPALLDDSWTFGGDDDSLFKSIKEGRAPTAMPAFKGALTDSDVRSLVIYIREGVARARAGSSGVAPAPGAPAAAPPPLPTEAITSDRHAFRLELVTDAVATPWGLDFLPDGRLILSERPGRVRIIDRGRVSEPIRGIPIVWVRQDGGLLDIAVHPQFDKNQFVYLAFSEPGAIPATSTTRIVRGRLRDGELIDQQTLFQAPPEMYWTDDTHFGARFLFDRQGRLFYSIGDRGREKLAQDLASPYGKLHRIYDDGRVPEDNPFVKKEGAVPSIWSYGHRNQQGLDFHPVTGELWATEHGPRGGDELNLIAPGRNYGWPVITFGMNYDGTAVTDKTAAPGLEQPIVEWTPSIAACAIEFYTGDQFPRWKHDLFVTALAHQELRRLMLDGRRVVSQEVLIKNLGRVRDVVTGPDGYLYIATNQPDRVVRLVPVDTPPTR